MGQSSCRVGFPHSIVSVPYPNEENVVYNTYTHCKKSTYGWSIIECSWYVQAACLGLGLRHSCQFFQVDFQVGFHMLFIGYSPCSFLYLISWDTLVEYWVQLGKACFVGVYLALWERKRSRVCLRQRGSWCAKKRIVQVHGRKSHIGSRRISTHFTTIEGTMNMGG